MPPPSSAAQRQQLARQLAPLLAAGAAAAAPTIAASLAAVGVTAAASSAALALLGARGASTVLLPTGPASRATAASEYVYRAAYLVAAAERIQSRIDQGMTRRQALLAERTNLTAHIHAAANRRRAAQAVDDAAARHGGLLGWRAVMDERTSAECARANGRNFLVTSRPVIGWPGAAHAHCRCRPVAPFAGAGLVDDVSTVTERREAVA